MANEIDRNILPEFIQKSFAISLGCMHKTVEMIKDPSKSLMDITTEVKALTTLPPDTEDGLAPKAKALAGNLVSRSMTIVEECRVAGEKFID